jgi:hypothetical protein
MMHASTDRALKKSYFISEARNTSEKLPKTFLEPEDSSAPVHTVYMERAVHPVQDAYVHDVLRLGSKYGFRCELLEPLHRKSQGAFEKHKILTRTVVDGRPEVLVPPEVTDDIVRQAELFSSYHGFHAYKPGFSTHYDAPYIPPQPSESYEKSMFVRHPIQTCIDGDNLLMGLREDGSPYALLGRDSLVLSTFFSERHTPFNPYLVQQTARTIQASKQYTSADIERIRTCLGRAKQIPPGWISWFLGHRYGRVSYEEAALFAAKMELTKKRICEELGLSSEQLVMVDQVDVHIDLQMHLMQPGHVVLNDPERCIEVLEDLLKDPALETFHKKQLEEMLEHAQKAHADLTPVLRAVEQQLHKAGLHVHRFPGSFQSQSRKAHFLHGLAGQTVGGKTFYFADASSVKPLQDRIRQHFEIELDIVYVEFVGAQTMPSGLTASEEALKKHRGLDAREIHTLTKPKGLE